VQWRRVGWSGRMLRLGCAEGPTLNVANAGVTSSILGLSSATGPLRFVSLLDFPWCPSESLIFLFLAFCRSFFSLTGGSEDSENERHRTQDLVGN
jgi:hypothetical protein